MATPGFSVVNLQLNALQSYTVQVPLPAFMSMVFPGLNVLSTNYSRYRITGVKFTFKIYAWQNVSTQTAWNSPLCFYVSATANQTPGLVPSITSAPEWRWCKYRSVGVIAAGSKPVTLSQYFAVDKISGPDRSIRDDLDYTGLTASTQPGWTNPATGPFFQYGIFTMGGEELSNNWIAAPNTGLTVSVGVKLYLKAWGKKLLTS